MSCVTGVERVRTGTCVQISLGCGVSGVDDELGVDLCAYKLTAKPAHSYSFGHSSVSACTARFAVAVVDSCIGSCYTSFFLFTPFRHLERAHDCHRHLENKLVVMSTSVLGCVNGNELTLILFEEELMVWRVGTGPASMEEWIKCYNISDDDDSLVGVEVLHRRRREYVVTVHNNCCRIPRSPTVCDEEKRRWNTGRQCYAK